MKLHLFCCISVLAGLCAQAQPVFTTNSLPIQVGQYSYSYFSSNVDVTAMLALATTNSAPSPPGGGTNVAQYWNFSKPRQSYESVLRTDIIAPQNGANSGNFPNATYAEQDTLEPDNQLGWRYYGFTDSGANSGRVCYGLNAPQDLPLPDWAAFASPALDIPSAVQLGQTWSGSVYWFSPYLIIPLSNYFSYGASVDAFGTLDLPGIGPVPALRVHEVDSCMVSDTSSAPPIPMNICTNHVYSWLVPGIGVAAQILVCGTNAVFPIDLLPCSNTVQRMYLASYFTNTVSTPPAFPTDLFIQPQNESVVLSWNTFCNAVNYRIDYTASISTNWQTLGYTNGTSWTDTMTITQRFYRVAGIP